MDERTEEAGLAGLLALTVGGKPVELPVLTIEQGEAWQRTLATTIAAIEVPEKDNDGGRLFGAMLAAEGAAMLEVVLAYDLTGALGDRDALRRRMTKRELAAAVKAMVDAEFPFDQAIGPSVVAAFGLQTQMVRMGLRSVTDSVESLQPASSTNGHSPSGVLTRELSAAGSPRSSSSSSGATARAARRAR